MVRLLPLPWVCQTMPAGRGAGHVRLRRPHPEVLVVAAGLPDARVEDHEVVHDLEQPLLGAELAQFPEQRIVPGGRMGSRLPSSAASASPASRTTP